MNLNLAPGKPLPYGISFDGDIINFALVSQRATAVFLRLFDYHTRQLIHEIPLTAKTGNVWHIGIKNLSSENTAYAFRIEGQQRHQADNVSLLDPYAKEVDSGNQWGEFTDYTALGLIARPTFFDWEHVTPPHIPFQDLIIYETHVRGFTKDPSSGSSQPGTYLGMIEKIPYLVDLGVNAVQLMPIFEFNEREEKEHVNPMTGERLYNYWGYSPINFFSPMKRYASSNAPASAINEFKTLVKELHRNGIEVLLDVVFNHTVEKKDTILSFKGIAAETYYIVTNEGNFRDYTGCGNTINANHPITREFIVDCLRYWVTEMHVDGFRFDLASALLRGPNGEPLVNPPLIEAITQDPLLATTKLIAEPWDAVGLYHVGRFYPQVPRWAEWNGKYRDTIRRFIAGRGEERGLCATRISGSHDLYGQRKPYHSINFITVHDGFTLADLCTYNYKHNKENGEDNRDGTNNNDSWNCGLEGPTSDEKITKLRERQMRNFHLILMISIGVPVLLMGDEYAHTKLGNNNTWCQDNKLNWFLWNQLEENNHFYRFYKGLIKFRKDNPLLRRDNFLSDTDILWHGLKPMFADWDRNFPFLAFSFVDKNTHEDIYVAINADSHPQTVELPLPKDGLKWHWIANTAESFPNDIFTENAPAAEQFTYKMSPHSSIILKAYN